MGWKICREMLFGHENENAVKNRQAKSNFHSFVTSPINPSLGHCFSGRSENESLERVVFY